MEWNLPVITADVIKTIRNSIATAEFIISVDVTYRI